MDEITKWASEIWGAHIKWGPGQIARLEKFHEKAIEAEQKKMQLWHDAVKEQHRLDILAEREACAKVCESLFDMDDDSCNEAETCAAAIRGRQ